MKQELFYIFDASYIIYYADIIYIGLILTQLFQAKPFTTDLAYK